MSKVLGVVGIIILFAFIVLVMIDIFSDMSSGK